MLWQSSGRSVACSEHVYCVLFGKVGFTGRLLAVTGRGGVRSANVVDMVKRTLN